MYSHPSKQGTYYSKPWNMDGFPPKWKGGLTTYMTEARHGAMTSGGSRSFLHPDFWRGGLSWEKLLRKADGKPLSRSGCKILPRWGKMTKQEMSLVDKPCKKKVINISSIYISHNSNNIIKGLKWQKREKWLKTANMVATCCGNYPCDC